MGGRWGGGNVGWVGGLWKDFVQVRSDAVSTLVAWFEFGGSVGWPGLVRKIVDVAF